MSLSEATVTMKYGEVNKLQTDIREAHSRIAELEQQVVDAKLGDHSSLANEYLEAFQEAMPIVRFAVGNLHPLTARGWPFQNLFNVADKLRDLPGISSTEKETAGDLRNFAEDAKRWEKARDEGREQELFQQENSARAPVLPT